MSPDEIKRIITESFTRYATDHLDPEKVFEHFAEDCDWVIMGDTAMSGRRTRAEMVAMLAAMPSLAEGGMDFDLTGWVIEGDRAAVEGTSRLMLKDGREYSNSYHWLIELKDGKIIRGREYLDTARMAAFFGAA
jgi:uncharacterized protein